MTVNRRLLLQTSSAVGALSLLRKHSVAGADDLDLALDWYPNANHAGLFVADQRGYFSDAGFNIDLYTPADPTTVLQTVGAGKDDFGISYQIDLLLARAQGVPVVSIAALAQHPLMGVMSLKERGITRPADLVGKTVGYPGIPGQEAFLKTMMESDDASLDDIDLINVEFNLVQATISKQVDAVMGAYWTHETLLAEREGYPVDLMRVEEWGVPDYYELIVVASEESVRDRPDVCSNFLQAMQRGYLEVLPEPAVGIEALVQASPEIDAELESTAIELLIPVWSEGVPIVGYQEPQRWSACAAWMVEAGLIPADLDISQAFTIDLISLPKG